VKHPDFARAACRAFPGQVAVGIDAKDGMVATEGWADVSSVTALDLALSFEDAGAAAIIHTDIDRDGMLGGVNVAATVELAARLSTPVIASGGVADTGDIVALKNTGRVAGTIIGRALYDGSLTARDAMAASRD
jgi:phosphoribosylformimino-5-aminoimidazole carboxamide ribotide isomerase